MGQLYLIYGNDEQSVKKKASAVAGKFTAGNDGTCDIETVNGDSGKYEDILEEFISNLQTPPFLTPQKVVYLRYFLYADKLVGNSDDLTQKAIELLLNPDENIHVIIECIQNPPDMRKSNAKKLKNIAVTEVCDSIKTTDKNFQTVRSEAIRDRLMAEGKTIAPDALKFLIDTLGSNSGVLDNELDKLCTFMGKDIKNLTLDICRTLCARTPESVIYFFTGALLERNLKAALSSLSDLIQNGEAEIRIMASVSNSITDLVKSRNAIAELGIDPDSIHPRTFDNLPADLKERFPNNPLLKMHPYRAFKVCESAASWSTEKLSKALNIASETNLALVSGNGNPRMVMEQMILKICTL